MSNNDTAVNSFGVKSDDSGNDKLSALCKLYDNLYEMVIDSVCDYADTLCIADYNSKVVLSGSITEKQACKDIINDFADYILIKSPNQDLTNSTSVSYFVSDVEDVLEYAGYGDDVERLYGLHDISVLLAASCLLKVFGEIKKIDVLFVHSHYELAEEYGLEEVAPWSEYEYFVNDSASACGFDVKTRVGSPLES